MDSNEIFVVALKRQCRETAPDNWKDLVEKLEDVEVLGTKTARAIRVSGPKGTGTRLAEKVGRYCHIEQVILHMKDEN